MPPRTPLATVALPCVVLGLGGGVGACGDNRGVPDAGDTAAALAIVGHSDLGARGMNAALAVAGDTVYVGSRIDQKPILIVDVADRRRRASSARSARPSRRSPGSRRASCAPCPSSTS